jgi:hypothetical protein
VKISKDLRFIVGRYGQLLGNLRNELDLQYQCYQINVTNLAILSIVAHCISSALALAWRKQHNNQTFTASYGQAFPIHSALRASVIPALPPAEGWAYINVVFAYHNAAQFLELRLAIAFLPLFYGTRLPNSYWLPA